MKLNIIFTIYIRTLLYLTRVNTQKMRVNQTESRHSVSKGVLKEHKLSRGCKVGANNGGGIQKVGGGGS